ncbi:MAG: hypothetical protein ABSA10_10775, partial [Anaerolineales bacterium]
EKGQDARDGEDATEHQSAKDDDNDDNDDHGWEAFFWLPRGLVFHRSILSMKIGEYSGEGTSKADTSRRPPADHTHKDFTGRLDRVLMYHKTQISRR